MIITGKQISEMEKRYRTSFINSLPGYKCLHMVGTADPYGNTNIGLFNSIVHFGANPPLLGIVLRPDTVEHDTLSNILATGCFTLNNVLPKWYKQAHQTSARYASGISEFDTCGFEPQYIEGFKAPFVQQASVKIGLELSKTIDIGVNDTTLVIGQVTHVIIDELYIADDGYVDHKKAGTITVAGLDSYFTTETLGRMEYAKAQKEPVVMQHNN